MTGAHALLAGSVDYAGLFPPAGLDMAEAARAYALYRRGRQAWMLGRFVVPAARLDEFCRECSSLGAQPGAPWRLAALLGQSLPEDLAAISRTNTAHGGPHGRPAIVDACEVGVDSAEAVTRLAERLEPHAVGVSYEIALAATDRPAVLAAILKAGGAAKIRTGGIVPEAIPPTAAVAAFIWDCIVAGVPFKATAGLHHPVRARYPLRYGASSPEAVMHGFLNVLAGAMVGALAWESGATDVRAGVALVDRVLSETDPGAFHIGRDGFRWREYHVPSAVAHRRRATTVLSVGSCSFTEPVEGLDALGIALDPPAPLEVAP